jgi:DNA polymerase-1
MASIFLRMWRSERPAYAAALFDRPEPTFRKKQYPEYKATRPPAPSELIQQIVSAHELFPAFGIQAFERAGYEADDLIATFAERFGKTPGVRVVILTGDTDTLQLVRDERIVVRAFRTGLSDTVTYDERAVRERYGLAPEQLADYKALVGDVSDNVKGVPGIGPKTAQALLSRFGTLDGMFRRIATEDPKRAARIVGFRDRAEEARGLVLLERNVPIPTPALEELRVDVPDARIREYLDEQGFASLIRRLDGPDTPKKQAPGVERKRQKSAYPKKPQGSMF